MKRNQVLHKQREHNILIVLFLYFSVLSRSLYPSVLYLMTVHRFLILDFRIYSIIPFELIMYPSNACGNYSFGLLRMLRLSCTAIAYKLLILQFITFDIVASINTVMSHAAQRGTMANSVVKSTRAIHRWNPHHKQLDVDSRGARLLLVFAKFCEPPTSCGQRKGAAKFETSSRIEWEFRT